MKISNIKTRKDEFKSRYFDYQITHKCLVKLEDNIFTETTAYEHFLKGDYVDFAIDLSTMSGCDMKCKFCASSSVLSNRFLTIDEIVEQAKFLIDSFCSSKFNQITCSFQGIGEPTLIPNKIIAVSKSLLLISDKIVLSLSSILANPIGLMQIISSGVIFNNIQISLIGTNQKTISKLTPNAISLDKIIDYTRKIENACNVKKTKINYILLKDLNDSEKDLKFLVNTFKGLNVVVKISSLNSTYSSEKHGLVSGDYKRACIFKNELKNNGIDSFVFGSFRDIEFSCGQLKIMEKL